MKYRFKKNVPLIKVDEPKIGQHYHVSWAYSRGVIGVCFEIDEKNKTVRLRNPKTKAEWQLPVKWDDLRHTRKAQAKMRKSNSN